MRIVITPVTTWNRVLNTARFTQGKEPIDKEPTDRWKKQQLLSEHSPIRTLEFDIRIYEAPYASVMHLVRHFMGVIPFVHTSRPDITGQAISRHDQRKDDPTDVWFAINAQALIQMSQFRLCNKAEEATRYIWSQIRKEMENVDPIMASCMVPRCVHYNGYCKEARPCGLCKTKAMDLLVESYHKLPSANE